jgi:hypothetical protein
MNGVGALCVNECLRGCVRVGLGGCLCVGGSEVCLYVSVFVS